MYEKSEASVWDDAERCCELSFQMGNGEFSISARYLHKFVGFPPQEESCLASPRATCNTERTFKRMPPHRRSGAPFDTVVHRVVQQCLREHAKVHATEQIIACLAARNPRADACYHSRAIVMLSHHKQERNFGVSKYQGPCVWQSFLINKKKSKKFSLTSCTDPGFISR